MKENKLTISINKPKTAVFGFTINPDNTPLWIESIVSEKANERPVGVGTRYTNIDSAGEEHIYEVSEILEGKIFELKSIPSGYTVRYTYKEISPTESEMEYHEWVEEGELKEPFEQKNLDKLKVVMELT